MNPQATPPNKVLLNPAQNAAVNLPLNMHGAILAGAGTGKTKTLVERIIFAIESGVNPECIIALTFTNKASKEMQARVDHHFGEQLETNPLISTFHSLGLRLIRKYGRAMGFSSPRNISPLDEDESSALLRRVIKQAKMEDFIEDYKPKKILSKIMDWKEHFILVHDLPSLKLHQDLEKIAAELYPLYEEEKRISQSIDFADLILYPVQLLASRKDICEKIYAHLSLLLVDEFQDVNATQILFMDLLTDYGKRVTTFVVGDDDQSIYSWRGSEPDVFDRYLKTYQPNTIVKLEENYRCSPNILAAANSVIANNEKRIIKTLFTQKPEGEKVKLNQYTNAEEEADSVAEQIYELINTKQAEPSEIAVLYRTNANSRSIEKACILRKIPYRIFGGVNFFQRREIKDAVAYLRIVNNFNDDQAFIRASQAPKRGIGEKTLQGWIDGAKLSGQSIYHYLSENPHPKGNEFISQINHLNQIYQQQGIHSLVNEIVDNLGLQEYYIKIAKDRGEECYDNLRELAAEVAGFNNLVSIGAITTVGKAHSIDGEKDDEEDFDILSEFLFEMSLNAEAFNNNDETNAKNENLVSLMTFHKSKGLEFKYIFIVAAEDGNIPKIRSNGEIVNLAEERRLFYVALTRGKKLATITYAKNRFSFDNSDDTRSPFADKAPSRFIQEIPRNLLLEKTFNNQEKVIFSPYQKKNKPRNSFWG